MTFLLTVVSLSLTSCGQQLYKFPEFTFAGRPIPPSLLAYRVMVSLTPNGTTGALEILDGNRDLRGNVQNTKQSFFISGFSGANPTQILNFPEQLRGYVFSNASGNSVATVNYGTETSGGSAGSFPGSTSVATGSDGVRFYSADEAAGQVIVVDNQLGRTFALNLPNAYRVAVNQGDTVALAMVRNSNTLYRVLKLNNGGLAPPGNVDCEPQILPVYCVVPVPGSYDRPQAAYFSTDGATAYVLNCGVECGGGNNGGASVSFMPQSPLTINVIPTSAPYPAVVTNTVAIPGGATVALSDGSNLYVAGQQLQTDGLFAGRLTKVNLSTLAVSAAVSISDGNHSKLIFGDDNTLWIGSQYCATGERAKQGLNYNCLTRYDMGTGAASIIPANVVPGSTAAGTTVPYPNTDDNQYYYGSLSGICWVQSLHKMYTAYGGQIHAFNTADGSEINNFNITVQGTALDVAFIDAATNAAN